MIFNLHFCDDDWCGYLFVYLLAICISSLVKYMFNSLVCLKNWVVDLLTVEFWEFFIHSGCQSVAYLFIPCTVSFVEQKFLIQWKVTVLVAQSCPTLCDPIDCSPPGSSVHGIFQARILEWVAISFSRGSSWPRDWTWVSHISGRFFYCLSHRGSPFNSINSII